MCSLDRAVIQPVPAQPPVCLGEPAGCRAHPPPACTQPASPRSRPAPHSGNANHLLQQLSPAQAAGAGSCPLPIHPKPLRVDQHFPLAPCAPAGRGCRGDARCPETSLQHRAPASPQSWKRDAQRMPEHSKATGAGGWSCSSVQPAHGHTLPAALRHASTAAGIPAWLGGTCVPATAQGRCAFLSAQPSAAKEWCLEVHFLPAFILAGSVATLSAALCRGTCGIMRTWYSSSIYWLRFASAKVYALGRMP